MSSNTLYTFGEWNGLELWIQATELMFMENFYKAIYTMREAKNEKMSIGESAIGVIELSKGINDVFDIVENMQQEQTTLQTKILTIEEKMSGIDKKLDALLSGR